MKRILLTFAASALAALFATVGTAAAGTNTSSTPFTIPCTSTSQVCDQPYQTSATTTATLVLEFRAAFGSCTNFSVAFYVDGALVHTSGVLASFQTTGPIDVGPVAAGVHALEVRATGETGGCNTGTLTSWSGRFDVTTNDDPPPPPPSDEEQEPDPGPEIPPDEGTDPEPEETPVPTGPTTKADCKNGGWKNFSEPTFKNQGECTKWVERHERDPECKPHKPPVKQDKPSKPSKPDNRREPNGKKNGHYGDWR